MAKRRSASRVLAVAAPVMALAAAAVALVRRLRGRPVVPVSDETIEARVREALAEPEHVPEAAVTVSVSDGVVTLAGDIGSPYTQATIDAAVRRAREVAGVRDVVDRLQLVGPDRPGGTDAAGGTSVAT